MRTVTQRRDARGGRRTCGTAFGAAARVAHCFASGAPVLPAGHGCRPAGRPRGRRNHPARVSVCSVGAWGLKRTAVAFRLPRPARRLPAGSAVAGPWLPLLLLLPAHGQGMRDIAHARGGAACTCRSSAPSQPSHARLYHTPPCPHPSEPRAPVAAVRTTQQASLVLARSAQALPAASVGPPLLHPCSSAVANAPGQ